MRSRQFEGIFMFTMPGRLVRPIRHLASGRWVAVRELLAWAIFDALSSNISRELCRTVIEMCSARDQGGVHRSLATAVDVHCMPE